MFNFYLTLVTNWIILLLTTMLNFQSEELKSKLLQSVSTPDLKLKTSQLPKRILLDKWQMRHLINGTLDTNLVFFQHFNLSKVNVPCDEKPFEPRFGSDQYLRSFHKFAKQSKEEGKDQKSIQSNTIPDLGHNMGKWQKRKTAQHTREQRGQPFPSM